MSSKKMRPTEPEENFAPENGRGQDTPEEYAASEENAAILEGLQKQLDEARAQTAEYKDGWQRSLADFQNYKRRVEAEKSETYRTAAGNIIKSYLPILDDLERALEARPKDLAWVDGIELICRKLQQILESEGLKKIDTVGQMFDPNFHEAISQEVSEDHQSGEIIAVVRNGYLLGDKVIRPAMVRVAK